VKYTVGSTTFEETDGISLRRITVVLVCLQPDRAMLTRAMLQAVAEVSEVVAMGEREVCVSNCSEWKYLGVGNN
jgi:hypothetical protein